MASSQSGAARSARERVAGRVTVLHAALLTILAGALFYFLVPEGRILVLFFLFLPVVFAGLDYLPSGAEGLPRGGWTLAFWAALLLLSAQITGWVTEDEVAQHSAPGHWEDPMKVLERERKRLALDLHDGIAQTVSATLMEVELLEALTSEDGQEVKTEVARLKEMCSGSLREIRT